MVLIIVSNIDVGLPNQEDKISNGNIKIRYDMKYKTIIDINSLTFIFTFIKIKKQQTCKNNNYYSNIIIY